MNPIVSIIIPVFNRASLVTDSIESVINQTCKKWELIVVDDYSTDNTVEVVSAYAKQDSRIQMVTKDTQIKGASSARNIGLAHSQGAWVIFLDSDDLLAPDALSKRLGSLDSGLEIDMLITDMLKFSDCPGDMRVRVNQLDNGEDPLLRFLRFDNPWLTVNVFWRKDFIKEIGGWDDSLPSWQDWELNIRALDKRAKYKIADYVDCYLRIPKGQSIGLNSTKPSHLEVHEKLLLKWLNIFIKDGNIVYVSAICRLSFLLSILWCANGQARRGVNYWKKVSITSRMRFSESLLFSRMKIYEAFYQIIKLLPNKVGGKLNVAARIILFNNLLPPRSRTFHKYLKSSS